MSNHEQMNPTGRFTGLADKYARYRPSYPAEAMDCLIRECDLAPGALVVDVGCGTGISTRLLAERGLHLIGVEPNDDMRKTAAQAASGRELGRIEYRVGSAEATGLDSGIAQAVTAFQAFHWFDGPRALAEFHRVLAPRGCVALMWNDRDDGDPLGRAYHDILSSTKEGQAVAASWRNSSLQLFHSTLFEQPRTFTFASEQVLDEDGLIGRAFSASYAPREPALVATTTADLRAAFSRFQVEGKVRMRYQVSLFVARRLEHTC
jgi:ubiquinone/menaquinone biosynthesis C-methylase UbiE